MESEVELLERVKVEPNEVELHPTPVAFNNELVPFSICISLFHIDLALTLYFSSISLGVGTYGFVWCWWKMREFPSACLLYK